MVTGSFLFIVWAHMLSECEVDFILTQQLSHGSAPQTSQDVRSSEWRTTRSRLRPVGDRASPNCYCKQEVSLARRAVLFLVSDWKCGRGGMLGRSAFVYTERVFWCCVYRVLTSSSCAAKEISPCCSSRTSPVSRSSSTCVHLVRSFTVHGGWCWRREYS